jgi:hypothetical protein
MDRLGKVMDTLRPALVSAGIPRTKPANPAWFRSNSGIIDSKEIAARRIFAVLRV